MIDTYKGSDGVWRTRVPADVASRLGEVRTAELTEVSRRALHTAQQQNLSLPKANGLLSRMASPVLKARGAGGIVGSLLQAGLIVGLTVALSNAVSELSKDSSTLTMTAGQCAALPPSPSEAWSRSTGIYRNGSSGSNGVAVQVTRGTSAGGTVAAPAGWTNSAQRNARSIGNGMFEWEVQFTKTVACGERIAFPPSVPDGSVPGPDHGGSQNDQNSSNNLGKIVSGLLREAAKDQTEHVPMPGGEIPGKVEEPGIPIPAPGSNDPGTPVPDVKVPASSYTAPRPGFGQDDTHFTFPDGSLPSPDTPTPVASPTPVPGGTPTPSPTGGGTKIDWGTPPPEETFPTVTPMSWFPTLFQPPQLSGACTGWTFEITKLGASIPLNPCPHLAMITPVVRPICAIGATVAAGKILLDI